MKNKLFVLILAVFIALTALPVTAAGRPDEGKGILSDDGAKATYSDISDCWCKEAAEKFDYSEIFEMKDGRFKPAAKITRMEFVRMLHMALDINMNYFAATDIKDFFDDVENEDAGAGNLYDLVITGIIDKKGSFDPDEQLARDEMIHYIINALKHMTDNEYAVIKMMPVPFEDDSEITPGYKGDIIEAVLLQLIYGRGNNMLFPRDGATRAEAAAVTARLVDLLKTLNTGIDVITSADTSEGKLKISLIIQNNTDHAITIRHNSGRRYDFLISDTDGDVLYQWSANKKFISALTVTVINTGETVEFTDELSEETYLTIKKEIAVITAYIDGTSDDFTIDPDGYRIYAD